MLSLRLTLQNKFQHQCRKLTALECRSLSILLKPRFSFDRKMWLDHKPFWLDCLPHSSVSSMERLFPWGYHYSTHLSVTLKLWCTPLSCNVELQAVPFAACFIFISLSYVIKCPPKVNTDRKELLFLFVYHNIRHTASNWSIFLEQMNECTHQITDHPIFQCTIKGCIFLKKKR